jgi:hypothetical protein
MGPQQCPFPNDDEPLASLYFASYWFQRLSVPPIWDNDPH